MYMESCVFNDLFRPIYFTYICVHVSLYFAESFRYKYIYIFAYVDTFVLLMLMGILLTIYGVKGGVFSVVQTYIHVSVWVNLCFANNALGTFRLHIWKPRPAVTCSDILTYYVMLM